MADPFDSDSLGVGPDAVRLTLGDEDVVIAESWEIKQSILTQPAAFSIRIGWGDVAAQLIKKYPPRTPFTLSIGNVVQQSGAIDAIRCDAATGATTLTIRGRDSLAPLHDAYITADESLQDATFGDVVAKALTASGIEDFTLQTSNAANRKAITGVGVVQIADPDGGENPQTQKINRVLQCKVGERQYHHVKKCLDRAGLFLWASTTLNFFILSEPNAKQRPAYRIVRQRGADRNAVNVISATFNNDTAGRYSEAIVYAKGGGKKFGRVTTSGAFVDDEMFNLGFTRPMVLKDATVTNAEQAEFYARRKLAETRRAGWQLSYTLAGHSTPSLIGGQRAVWAVDTVVEVDDEEFGLQGQFYIESVEFRRGPETTTVLTLQRPQDLIFGSDED